MSFPRNAPPYRNPRSLKFSYITISLAAIAMAGGCSGTSATTTTTTTTTGNTQYVAAYKAASWGSTVTVTFPSTCQMILTTTGRPDYMPNPWYLAPAGAGQTVVARSAVTNTAMALIAYSDIAPSLEGSSVTLDICPAKAASTTATSLGAIGYLISGTALFNPFEMDATTPAVADNASYTFTDGSGNIQTAYFLDQCDSHSNGMTWHAHGNPNCVTSQVDTSTGPSHIIGIALDGYPIYGGRDVNGNVIAVSQLDACNGITSPTPEFPSGVYHYVLPIGVTTQYASINCYTGVVSDTTIASAKKQACNMKQMFAMIESAQEARRKHPTKSRPNLAATPAGTMDMASMQMGSM